MRLPFLSLLALCFLPRTADGGEPQGPVPKVLEVTDGVDVAKLEKFAAVPGLTIQIDMRSETVPEPLVALLEGSLASKARWVALPATPTPLAIEQARRLRPARLIVTLGPDGLDPKLAVRLKSFGQASIVFELPSGFGRRQLDSIRALAPAFLSYQTEAGEPLTKQQVSLLAREKPTKLVRVLPNDGPDELLGLVSGLAPLELDVLHLPGVGPEVLAPLKQKLSGVDVALLVGDGFQESDLAPWTRLPRFTLKFYAGDLSGMPQDLPKHQERVGQGDGTGLASTEPAPAVRIGKQLGQKMLGVFEARPEQFQGSCREAWSKATQAWLEYLQSAFKDAGAESGPRELQALAEDYARSSEKQLDTLEEIDEMASTNKMKPAIDATRKARKICGAAGK